MPAVHFARPPAGLKEINWNLAKIVDVPLNR